MDCIFCHGIKKEQILATTDNFFIIYDINPIQIGHLLIISKKHYDNIKNVPFAILTELIMLEQYLSQVIENNFDVLGVSIIMNNGRVMDENTHFHAHIIPRYTKDTFWDNQHVIQHNLSLKKLSQLLSTKISSFPFKIDL